MNLPLDDFRLVIDGQVAKHSLDRNTLTMPSSHERTLSSGQPSIGNRESFFKQVYAIVRSIPRGTVLTYGQIAMLLGAPTMARQVGWAMHGCPKGLPWQRVVGAGGRLLINSLSKDGGSLLQRQLLELEGVRFNGKLVDISRHQYVPQKLKRLNRKKKAVGPKTGTKHK
jgi:methylated-DNA-protein-cysteine methyltransferase-like protein